MTAGLPRDKPQMILYPPWDRHLPASLIQAIRLPPGETSLLPTERRYLLKLRTSRALHDVTLEGCGVTLPQQQGAELGRSHDGGHSLLVRMSPTPCTARIVW